MSAGKLGSHRAISTGVYNVYEVPEGVYAKTVITVVGELSGSGKVVLYVSPTATPTAEHTIQIENISTVNTGFDRTAVVLKEGDFVSYYSDVPNITVTVTGNEYPTNNKELSDNSLITANGEYVLYDTPTDVVSAVNLCVSGTSPTSTTSATTKLYISTTNASGGSLIVNNTVGGFNTGYEKTGVILKEAEKLILVVSDLSGSLATRVQGFEREE